MAKLFQSAELFGVPTHTGKLSSDQMPDRLGVAVLSFRIAPSLREEMYRSEPASQFGPYA